MFSIDAGRAEGKRVFDSGRAGICPGKVHEVYFVDLTYLFQELKKRHFIVCFFCYIIFWGVFFV